MCEDKHKLINIPLTRETTEEVLRCLMKHREKDNNKIAYAIDIIKFVLNNEKVPNVILSFQKLRNY